jgi:hypothetical protein
MQLKAASTGGQRDLTKPRALKPGEDQSQNITPAMMHIIQTHIKT